MRWQPNLLEELRIFSKDGPVALGVDTTTGTIYAVIQFDNTVSVMDADAVNVVAKVKFHISPFKSGYVQCDGLVSPSGTFLVWFGSQYKAIPENGFQFMYWIKNLDVNSTEILQQISQGSSRPFKPLLDFINTLNVSLGPTLLTLKNSHHLFQRKFG